MRKIIPKRVGKSQTISLQGRPKSKSSPTAAPGRRNAPKTAPPPAHDTSVRTRSSLSEKTVGHDRPAMVRPDTKQARVLAMLREPAGTTVAAIATAVGWQPHSVRGFLAGVVRKRLSLNLVSESGDHGRIYRVANGNSTASPRRAV